MHAVSHDDHPGNAGYPSVLHLLVGVTVSSMRVSVAVRVSVLLGLVDVCFCGRLLVLLGVGERQRRLVGGGVGRLELCELCVIVTAIAGDGCALWV